MLKKGRLILVSIAVAASPFVFAAGGQAGSGSGKKPPDDVKALNTGNLVKKGEKLLSEGKSAEIGGDLDGAYRMYSEALDLLEKAGDPSAEGNAHCRIADLFTYRGDFQKARENYEKAQELYSKAENISGRAQTLEGIGNVFKYTGQYDKAEDSFRQAASILRGQKNEERLAVLNLSLGELYTVNGKFAEAVEVYEETADILARIDYPAARGVLNIQWGNVCRSTGELGKALSMFRKAAEILEETPLEFYLGMAYAGMGSVYNSAGRSEDARDSFELALKHYEKAQGPAGLATTYEDLGSLYVEKLKEEERGVEMLKRSLSLHEQSNNVWGQCSALIELGKYFMEKGDRESAAAEFDRACKLAEGIGAQAFLAYARVEQAPLEWSRGEKEKAVALLDAAVSHSRAAGYFPAEMEARFRKAGYLATMKRNDEAVVEYESALSLMEKERRGAAAPELQGSYLKSVSDAYLEAASFMLENGFQERAFKVAESLKARLFLDQLAEGLVDVDKGLNPVLKRKLEDMLGLIDSLRGSLSQEADPENSGEAETKRKELKEAERRLGELMLEIRLESPAYASVHYPEPATAGQIRKDVLQPGEVMIEYLITRETVWAFVLSRQGFDAVRIPVSRRALETALASYMLRLSEPVPLDLQGREAGRKLYEWLILPLEPLMPKGWKMIVVPDGTLARLPFEALVVKTGKRTGKALYLIKKRQVQYSQSATVLKLLRKDPSARSFSGGFVGFGDPVYQVQDLDSHEGYTRGDDAHASLARLPGSGKEVRMIADLFQLQKREGKVFLREDAREERAKSPEMGKYGFVHFACHGLMEKNRQSLALSLPEGKSNNDGFLTLGELMNCSFDARLVVLSACRTGLGDYEVGEGVTGLTRAALYAGSDAAVVSLWDVDDEGTQDLMTAFYRHVLENGGGAPGSSLRSAKMEVMRGKRSAPFYWGAFVLYGE